MNKYLFCAIMVVFTFILLTSCTKTEIGEKSLLEISISDDFKMSVGSVSPTGIEIKVSNNSSKTLYWGSWFALEKKENNNWYEVTPTKLKNNETTIAWTNSLAFLNSFETINIDQQWEYGYGKLSKGDYRIVKYFFFDERNQDEKIYVACEFSIE